MENKKNENKKEKSKNIGKIFSIIITILAIGSFGYLAFRIFEANILPTKYFIGFTVGIGMILIIILLLSFIPKNKVLNSIFRVLGVLLSALFIFVSTYFTSFTDFVKEIVDSTSNVNYHLVVRKNDSDYVNDYQGKNIGAIEMNNEESDKFLKDIKLTDFEMFYGPLSDIAESLLKEDLDAIVLNDTTLETLKEDDSEFDFDNQFKVIESFKQEVIDDTTSYQKVSDVTKDSFIVYISGLDTYGKITNRSRSDVNILAVVNPSTNKILLVHIPRDAYMKFAGTSGNLKDKLTHAGVYGINTSVKTIENYFNININYYVKINFTTLVQSVDTLGGITVYNDTAFKTYNGISFAQGNILLNGDQALAYSRERKSLASGDVSRGQHQQDVIVGLINKATSPSIITKANSLLKNLGSSFDTNMSGSNIQKLIKKQLNDMNNWSVESYSLSGKGLSEYTYTYPKRKLYVMELDPNQVDTAKSLINSYMK